MDIPEQYLQLCHHITALTGAHSTLLHILSQSFLKPPFLNSCTLDNNGCTASRVHLFSAYEAQRWGGKYMYYCPQGFLFLSVIPYTTEAVAEYCIIAGPIIMENNSDDLCDETFGGLDSLDKIPHLTTSQVYSLCELITVAVSTHSPTVITPQSNTDSFTLAQIIKDYTINPQTENYPVESEQQLQEYIRTGNKKAAQKLLNELLLWLYTNTNNDLMKIKPRIHELLVLMNRAAIDGGADIDEIFHLCCRCEQEMDSIQSIDDMDRWFCIILNQFIGFVFDFDEIKHKSIILKITNYIKEHLTERISLEQAAAQVYLSKSYFCRIIKHELGCTFTEYVNRLRVDRSKILLYKSELSIAEISTAVGFKDQSYFTRIFKRLTDMSPKKYRNHCRQSKHKL